MAEPAGDLAPPGGWISVPARLVAPPPAERGWLFRMVSRFSKRLGRSDVPDVITVLHTNPRLFWGWLYFASRLMPYGRLPARLREVVILRTAWNCRSRYEWGQHVDIGLSVGLGDDEVVRVTRGPDSFEGIEQAALRACDEICAKQVVSDETWSALSAHYNRKLLIELTMLVGHYIMIAAFLNSSGLALEPAIEAKLQAFHSRIGKVGPGHEKAAWA